VENYMTNFVGEGESVAARTALEDEVVDRNFCQVSRDEAIDAVCLMQAGKGDDVDPQPEFYDFLDWDRNPAVFVRECSDPRRRDAQGLRLPDLIDQVV
jgi:hypothetical protein